MFSFYVFLSHTETSDCKSRSMVHSRKRGSKENELYLQRRRQGKATQSMHRSVNDFIRDVMFIMMCHYNL
jgi:hypothetical protein